MYSKKLLCTGLACCLALGMTATALAASSDNLTSLSNASYETLKIVDSKMADTTTPISITTTSNSQNEDKVVNIEDLPSEKVDINNMIQAGIDSVNRATNTINWNIPGNTRYYASTSYSMEVGETLTINSSYSPRSANVDFGFISPSGVFTM